MPLGCNCRSSVPRKHKICVYDRVSGFYRHILVPGYYRTYHLYKKYKEKGVCCSCYYRQHAEIWLQFVVYMSVIVGGVRFIFTCIKWTSFRLCVLGFQSLMYFLSNAWNMFKGPFFGENSRGSNPRESGRAMLFLSITIICSLRGCFYY